MRVIKILRRYEYTEVWFENPRSFWMIYSPGGVCKVYIEDNHLIVDKGIFTFPFWTSREALKYLLNGRPLPPEIYWEPNSIVVAVKSRKTKL